MTEVRPVERLKHTRLHRLEAIIYGAGVVATVLLAAVHFLSTGSL